MARLKVHIDRLIQNIEIIAEFMNTHHKQWSLVVKVLGTDKAVLTRYFQTSCHPKHDSIAVSQWKSLKMVKDLNQACVPCSLNPIAKERKRGWSLTLTSL